MPRAISFLVVSALLTIGAVTPARAATSSACSEGDVQSLANAGVAIGKQRLRGSVTGSSGAWSCQFRLYDDNDDPNDSFTGPMVDNPEVPHVFKSNGWTLAGIFLWFTKAELAAFEMTRQDAIDYMNAVEDRLDWRPQGGEWTELPLTATPYRSVRFPSGEVAAAMQHRYHIFPGGSLAPGVYEWRWVQFDPNFDPPEFIAHGEVHVVN